MALAGFGPDSPPLVHLLESESRRPLPTAMERLPPLSAPRLGRRRERWPPAICARERETARELLASTQSASPPPIPRRRRQEFLTTIFFDGPVRAVPGGKPAAAAPLALLLIIARIADADPGNAAALRIGHNLCDHIIFGETIRVDVNLVLIAALPRFRNEIAVELLKGHGRAVPTDRAIEF